MVPAYMWVSLCPYGHYMPTGVTLPHDPCTHINVTLSPRSLHAHRHHLVPIITPYAWTSPCPYGHYVPTNVTLTKVPENTDTTLHLHHPQPSTPPAPPRRNPTAKTPPRPPRARPASHHHWPPPPATTAGLCRPTAAWPGAQGSARAAVPSRYKASFVFLGRALVGARF